MSSAKIGTCLVTGATGFVGLKLCALLQKQGWRVRAMLRREQSGPWDETVICDLQSVEQHKDELFSGIDTVFHLAAAVHLPNLPVDGYRIVNIEGTQALATCAENRGVKSFIFVSSVKAMGPSKQIQDEETEEHPETPYGKSKLETERWLLKETNFEHLVIIRPCLVYGVGVIANLEKMISWIDKGIFPPLPNTKTERSMVSVDNLAHAVLHVATDKRAHRQCYIVTDKEDYNIYGFYRDIRKVLGKGKEGEPLLPLPYAFWKLMGYAGDLASVVWAGCPISSKVVGTLCDPEQYSSKKLQNELQWQPQDSLENHLEAMIHSITGKS